MMRRMIAWSMQLRLLMVAAAAVLIFFGLTVLRHMPLDVVPEFAAPRVEIQTERLDGISALTVREAREGDVPRQGLVLIAPGDKHLEVTERGALRIADGPLINGCRPSADVTMVDAARVLGRRAIGLVMTGMGRDGAKGMKAIKAAEGKTLAQDKDSSVIFGMPKAAIDAGVVDEVLPLEGIAGRLKEL